MIKENGHWLISADNYFDMFAGRTAGAAPKEPRIVSGEQGTSDDVGIMGFYVTYNRTGAQSYAQTYCHTPRNPAYKNFTNNCANFVSQAVKEGGGAAVDYGGGDSFIWWYNNQGTSSTSDDTNSTSWSVAHDQAYNWSRNSYGGPAGSYVTSATSLALGDTIYYDFDGDGILDHSAIVVGFSGTTPYVAYNTTDTCWRHWDLGAATTKFLKLNNSFYYN